jgi:hypothetical protein
MVQGDPQVPQQRGNSPPILISYNEMQRGVSPQQGSIVTQVYKPINQQQQAYESKPQSNISQPIYINQQNGQQVQLVPQQQQIIQQIPQPQPPPQQQVQQLQQQQAI